MNTYLPIFTLHHGIKILEVLDELFNDIPHVDSLSCLFNEVVLTNEEEPENYSDSDEQSDNFELENLSEDELNLE